MPFIRWIIELCAAYRAAGLVGTTIFRLKTGLTLKLQNGSLAYIAEISYALYVLHPAFVIAGRQVCESKGQDEAKRAFAVFDDRAAGTQPAICSQRWITRGKRYTSGRALDLRLAGSTAS